MGARGDDHPTEPEWIVKQCEFMLHVGIDLGSSSGQKHARAQKLCPSADLSIVTNEQGYEHTEQAWGEFGADFLN